MTNIEKFFDKIKRSIIVNFMIENDIEDVNIIYNKENKEIEFILHNKNNEKINEIYKIPKKRSKRIKKQSEKDILTTINTDTDIDNTNEESSNDNIEVSDTDDAPEYIRNNINKHDKRNISEISTPENYNKKSKINNYRKDEITYNSYSDNIDKNEKSKNISLFEEDICDEVDDDNIFVKDEFCLKLLYNILMYEKKLLNENNIDKLKNVEIIFDKIKNIFIELGFSFDLNCNVL